MKTYVEFIYEGASLGVPFTIGERLEDILLTMKNPISDRMLLDIRFLKDTNVATMIDVDDKRKDCFTYIPADEVNKYLQSAAKSIGSKKYELVQGIKKASAGNLSGKKRCIRVGRLLRKLYGTDFSNKEVEDFINQIKAARTTSASFEVVTGEDIAKYYLWSSYDDTSFDGSPLGDSCMQYDVCQAYIDFYVENDGVSLLILRSDDDKIQGRALLWNLSEVDGQKVNGKFLDWVYYTWEYQILLFQNYAKERGWYHIRQNRTWHASDIWDPHSSAYAERQLKTVHNFHPSAEGLFPYVDTMKYFYVERGFLSNTELEDICDEVVYVLDDDGGEYTEDFKPCIH